MARRRVPLLSGLLLRSLAKFVFLMNPYALAILELRRVVLLGFDLWVLDAPHRIHQHLHLLLRFVAVVKAIFAEMCLAIILGRLRQVFVGNVSLSDTI